MTRPTLEELEEAADWLEDAADGWTTQQRADFLDWLADQPSRLEAVRRIAHIMADPMVDAALREAMEPPVEAPRPARRRIFPAMAAAVAALAIGAGGWIWVNSGEHLVTPAGPALVQKLADGSTVHLDGHSDLTVHLRAHSRDLDLAQGSGLFEVAHAPDRPFTVRSGPVAVTAVGTIFEVSRIGAATMIRVQQGRVRVTDGGALRYVSAGQGLYLAPAQTRSFTFHADPATATSGQWLDAQGDRLDSILARLSHASDRPLDCDPDLAARPVTGRYSLRNPEGSLRLIALANGWVVEMRDGGWHLRPA